VKQALILDCNYICHAVYHSMPSLSYNTKNTSVIFGFMKKIISFSSQFQSYKLVFVWDSKYSIRKEVYPDYKKLREKRHADASEEEKRSKRDAHRQFSEIRDVVLPMLGFKNIYSQDGYEADDLMASIKENNPGYKLIIVTTDKDMYQLISDNCMLYSPASKSMQTVTTFYDEFGCNPSMWGKARAISGCSTDNVKGVSGVAEKTAIKYLTGKLNPNTKKYQAIHSSGNMIRNNEELIVLPMYGTDKIEIREDDNTDRHKLIKVCEKYNFLSLITERNLNIWDRIS